MACWEAQPPRLVAASRTAAPRTVIASADYASALAAADRFLQAWQSGDMENGIILLTTHARTEISHDDLQTLFSSSAPAAYEINHGKPLRRGRYEFPVMLFANSSSPAGTARLHRRFSSIVVLRTGNNDWAIDKLP